MGFFEKNLCITQVGNLGSLKVSQYQNWTSRKNCRNYVIVNTQQSNSWYLLFHCCFLKSGQICLKKYQKLDIRFILERCNQYIFKWLHMPKYTNSIHIYNQILSMKNINCWMFLTDIKRKLTNGNVAPSL